ncbi:MAG: hypothetical protein KGZ39_06250 [Simkania sp.]|nr:hypothetical protein [Simkania sp.]
MGVGPIHRSSGATTTQRPAAKQLVQKLKSKIDRFNELIPPEEQQLPDFANATIDLDETSRKALETADRPADRLMEDMQNSAQTIQTVITQPLNIENASENVSLISAAVSFSPDQGRDSDLYKVSQSFMQYPDQTASLKIELTLSSQDLSSD